MSLLQHFLLVAAIYNLILVLIILVKTRSNQAGRNFAWYILGTAAWTICVALMDPRYGRDFTLWLARSTFFCATGFAIAWLWFCADFPAISSHFRRRALLLTLVGIPWAILSWTSWMIPTIKFETGWVNAGSGVLVLPFAIWLFLCGGAGLLHLQAKARSTRGFERQQIRYILLGGIGIVVAGSIPDLILPALTGSTRYAIYGPLASLFVTTTTTYAIVRYRLMDIKIVVRDAIIYSLTLGILALLFTLSMPLFDALLKDTFHFHARLGTFLTALFIALAFQPILRQTRHLVDHHFFKSVYDYRVTLRKAANALASVHDRESLMVTLEEALVRTLRPRWVAVYLPGHDDVLTRMLPITASRDLPLTLPKTEPLLAYAVERDDVMLMEEMIRCLEPAYGLGQRLKNVVGACGDAADRRRSFERHGDPG